MSLCIELSPPHPTNCPVCGGKGRVKVSGLRWRVGRMVASWPARVVSCPLRSGVDDLRAMLPREAT